MKTFQLSSFVQVMLLAVALCFTSYKTISSCCSEKSKDGTCHSCGKTSCDRKCTASE